MLRVLRVWRDWFIFSDDILNGLQVHAMKRCRWCADCLMTAKNMSADCQLPHGHAECGQLPHYMSGRQPMAVMQHGVSVSRSGLC